MPRFLPPAKEQAARASHTHKVRAKLKQLGALEQFEQATDREPDLCEELPSLGGAPRDHFIGHRADDVDYN